MYKEQGPGLTFSWSFGAPVFTVSANFFQTHILLRLWLMSHSLSGTQIPFVLFYKLGESDIFYFLSNSDCVLLLRVIN